MQIEVSDETGRKIEKLMASGTYASIDEMLTVALEAAEYEDAFLQDVEAEIARGVAAMRRGRTTEVTPGLADDIVAAGMRRRAAGLEPTGT